MSTKSTKEERDLAGQMFAMHEKTIEEIASELGYPFSLVSKWHTRYDWAEKRATCRREREEEIKKRVQEKIISEKVKMQEQMIDDYTVIYNKLQAEFSETDFQEILISALYDDAGNLIAKKVNPAAVEKVGKILISISKELRELLSIEGLKQQVEISGDFNNPMADLTKEELKALIAPSGDPSE